MVLQLCSPVLGITSILDSTPQDLCPQKIVPIMEEGEK